MIREQYLKKIRPYYESEQIKALVGIRRAGKSTILKQIMDELSSSVEKDRIFYMDFEDFESTVYKNNPSEFYSYIQAFTRDKQKCFIFLDEVQRMIDFENVIASIKAKLNCSLFVTSSDSKLLIGKMAKVLTGRVDVFYIAPFQYSEVLKFLNVEDSDEQFNKYMEYGGFPLIFSEYRNEPKRYLNQLYQAIIEQDIFSERKIRNKDAFKAFASFVIVHSGELISSKNINSYLVNHNQNSSVDYCYSNLDALKEAFLINQCKRYDIRGKALLETISKYYPVDPGIITINEGSAHINRASVLETIIYNELIFEDYEVHAGKTYNKEIDFVIFDGIKKCYIQVAYSIAEKEVEDREFSALNTIRDNCPKYVMTLDKFDASHDGIKHININKFLIGASKIELG